MNDQKTANFIRKHRVTGPLIMALILAIVLMKFTNLSSQVSIGIAALVGLSDYFALNWLLKRAESHDE